MVSTNSTPTRILTEQFEVDVSTVIKGTDGNVLAEIGQMLENKDIIPVVEKTFNLSEAKEAHELIKTGHSSGKIILKI